MNILPKKRWHVRNRENIARVRRDEANAAQEESERQERIKLAETEARRELLLQRSRSNLSKLSSKEFLPLDSGKKDEQKEEHVNFFKELEDGSAEFKKSNKEHEKEQKEEKEKYEKQIGYLTYLGQDTNEALGQKSWYECVPDRSTSNAEVNLKSKLKEDPLEIIKKYEKVGKSIDAFRNEEKLMKYKPILEKVDRKMKRRDSSNSEDDSRYNYLRKKLHKKHKSKKRRKSSSDESMEDSEDETAKIEKQRKLEILRIERLKRENAERKRTEELLAKLRGEKKESTNIRHTAYKPKYNSQFNPELARQNYDRR